MQTLSYWFEAARFKTLPASICPVLIGSACAFSDGLFSVEAMLYSLLFAILCQIGTNFANDYLDYKKGSDTPSRLGPRRLVSSGLVKPSHMRMAALFVLLAAFLVGLNLIRFGGPWLLIIGLSSILFAWCYTGGPYPLAYNALGDIFVIIFFGIVAVAGTYFVHTLMFSWLILLNGVACGLFINNLLVINNLRDYHEDLRSQKNTSIVLFGPDFGVKLYTFACWAGLGAPIINSLYKASLMPLIGSIPAVICLIHINQLKEAQGKDAFELLLKKTGLAVLLYGILLSLGLSLT